MRFLSVAVICLGLALAPATGCMSKRAKKCLKLAKAAKKGGSKAEISHAYEYCASSCTHDKHKEVCKARDDMAKLAGHKK